MKRLRYFAVVAFGLCLGCSTIDDRYDAMAVKLDALIAEMPPDMDRQTLIQFRATLANLKNDFDSASRMWPEVCFILSRIEKEK